jgi:hypothetical protein
MLVQDAAEEMYNRALSVRPYHDTTLYNFGLLKLRLGQHDYAKRLLEKCVRALLVPRHVYCGRCMHHTMP